MTKQLRTASELVLALTKWLEPIVGFSGYAFAYPEPRSTGQSAKPPFFVVTAQSGQYGRESSNVEIAILLEVAYQDSQGENYVDAVLCLRNAIDAICQALFRSSDGLFWGLPFGDISWQIPESPARPIWEAQVNVVFNLPNAALDCGDWLT